MSHTNKDKQKMINSESNKTIKSIKNQNVRRNGKLQVLGYIRSAYVQTEMKKKKKQEKSTSKEQ